MRYDRQTLRLTDGLQANRHDRHDRQTGRQTQVGWLVDYKDIDT